MSPQVLAPVLPPPPQKKKKENEKPNPRHFNAAIHQQQVGAHGTMQGEVPSVPFKISACFRNSKSSQEVQSTFGPGNVSLACKLFPMFKTSYCSDTGNAAMVCIIVYIHSRIIKPSNKNLTLFITRRASILP